MEKKVTVNIGGMFSTLLLIAFIVLKLCNVITWSWLWVLAPLWLPLAISIVILVFVALWVHH